MVAVRSDQDLWLLDGTRTTRFTFDAGGERIPVWSPDGSRIVFRRTIDLYEKRTSGAGEEIEPLVVSDQLKVPSRWSADGRFPLYHRIDETDADLWVVPTMGDRTPSVFLKTPFREAWGAFSPDGRWVAFQSDESGRPEIYVRPFVPPDAAEPAVAFAGGQWQLHGGRHPSALAARRERALLPQHGGRADGDTRDGGRLDVRTRDASDALPHTHPWRWHGRLNKVGSTMWPPMVASSSPRCWTTLTRRSRSSRIGTLRR